MIKGARLKHEYGPFDIIGDVHGCFDELRELLGRLGYVISEQKGAANRLRHAVHQPDKRKLVFVGDLVDRGPKIVDVLRLVTWMVDSRVALCVPGNHDNKLLRRLRGHNVRIAHGLAQTLEELDREPPEFKSRVAAFFQNLPSHYVLDGGNLVVAHAGLKEDQPGSTTPFASIPAASTVAS
jgi:protein phosphatase